VTAALLEDLLELKETLKWQRLSRGSAGTLRDSQIAAALLEL
jgi:hypothetical protein